MASAPAVSPPTAGSDAQTALSALYVPFPAPTPVSSASTSLALSPSGGSEAARFEFGHGLDLASIRDTLIRLEESIIFALIERAQFRRNETMYRTADSAAAGATSTVAGADSEASTQPGSSMLSRFLASTEALHASVRRYTSPCEHPFSDAATLPPPSLPQLAYPQTIKPNAINHNARIMKFYLGTVLPSICAHGDDSNYGSSLLCDVHALQLLSKRIHYGKFVAESKFVSERETFTRAIETRDIAALTNLITKPSVEEQVLRRVRAKAATYGRPPSMEDATTAGSAAAAPSPSASPESERDAAPFKIPPVVIAELYEQIMTMTKDVQIEYLLQRLD